MTSLKFLKCLTTCCLCFSSLLIYAQSDMDTHDLDFEIPEISLMDIEPNRSTITLALDAPTEAGSPLTAIADGTDNSKWINYSSSLAPATLAKSITAQITGGTLPGGISLSLQASAYAGSGDGVTGTSAGSITLSGVAQSIITGIGGAYTGNGAGNGHQLTYTLSITDHNALDFDESTTVEVTFTITN